MLDVFVFLELFMDFVMIHSQVTYKHTLIPF